MSAKNSICQGPFGPTIFSLRFYWVENQGVNYFILFFKVLFTFSLEPGLKIVQEEINLIPWGWIAEGGARFRQIQLLMVIIFDIQMYTDLYKQCIHVSSSIYTSMNFLPFSFKLAKNSFSFLSVQKIYQTPTTYPKRILWTICYSLKSVISSHWRVHIAKKLLTSKYLNRQNISSEPEHVQQTFTRTLCVHVLSASSSGFDKHSVELPALSRPMSSSK